MTHHVRHARDDEEYKADEELSHHVKVVWPLRFLGLYSGAHLATRPLGRSASGVPSSNFDCQKLKNKNESPPAWRLVDHGLVGLARSAIRTSRPAPDAKKRRLQLIGALDQRSKR